MGIRFVTLLQGTYFSISHPHNGGCGIPPEKIFFKQMLTVRLIIDSEVFVIYICTSFMLIRTPFADMCYY